MSEKRVGEGCLLDVALLGEHEHHCLEAGKDVILRRRRPKAGSESRNQQVGYVGIIDQRLLAIYLLTPKDGRRLYFGMAVAMASRLG